MDNGAIKTDKAINGFFYTAKTAVFSARNFVKPYSDVFYFLFLAFLIWGKSTYIEKTPALNVFFAISAVCLAVKCLFTDWSLIDLCKAAALVAFGGISYITSKHSILLVTLAGIVGAKDVNLKKVLSMCLAFRIALYITVVAFANMNVIPSDNLTSFETVNGETVVVNRYTLGFTMSNAAHILFLVTAALYIAVNYKKFGFAHAAVIIILNVILYNLTNCRTGFAILFVIVVIALLFKIDRVYKAAGRVVPCLACVCALACVACSYLYGKVGFIDRIDEIISCRFSYSALFINYFGLSLFGADTSALVVGSQVMDVAYVNLAVNYGIVAFVFFMVMDVCLAARSIKKGDKGFTAAYIAMALVGTVENYTLDIGINFTLAFATEIIFPRDEKNALPPLAGKKGN